MIFFLLAGFFLVLWAKKMKATLFFLVLSVWAYKPVFFMHGIDGSASQAKVIFSLCIISASCTSVTVRIWKNGLLKLILEQILQR